MRNATFLGVLVALFGAVSAAESAGKPARAVTDPALAGPDFAVQGEYQGAIQGEKTGAQVVALGDGKFRCVLYRGGLPGDGWNGKDRGEAEGQTADGKTAFKAAGDRGGAVIRDGVLTLEADGKIDGTLKKVDRASPTLGAKPPEGAVVLFDGKSAEAFIGGHVTPEGFLGEGDTSKQKFQSFTIHLEFRCPFQPFDRGQGRGNSGFYAQGRYEAQILDSFGLVSKKDDCAAIYGVRAPSLNMCYPPLAWQTYDIDFTAAEYKDGKKVRNATMTVRHNGVVVQDKVEVPRATTAAPVREGPEPGPVYLQNHGNPVRFRNLWVVEK